MDQIRIDNLCVFAHHGVFDFETRQGQNFYVNAVLYTDLHKAGTSDNLQDSTNYGEVCEFINEFMTTNTYQLIETAAEQMAKAILLQFPLVEGITLEIKKPSAPINLPFESVSVRIERSWHDGYLSFGSNMGEREKYIREGLKKLEEHDSCKLLECSKLLWTKPYGGVEQDDFLNGACHIKTLLTPQELLSLLHKIEQEAGRERKIHWGPRTLDLDILFYDDRILESQDLTIPHPDMGNRLFVLEPMNEIAPFKHHPVTGLTIRQMLEKLKH